MAEPLFNEKYNTYNEIAIGLDSEATKVIRPLLEKYSELGYSPREIAYVIERAVSAVECEHILRKSIDRSRKERKAENEFINERTTKEE